MTALQRVDLYLSSPFRSLDRSYGVIISALPDEECFAKISEKHEGEKKGIKLGIYHSRHVKTTLCHVILSNRMRHVSVFFFFRAPRKDRILVFVIQIITTGRDLNHRLLFSSPSRKCTRVIFYLCNSKKKERKTWTRK